MESYNHKIVGFVPNVRKSKNISMLKTEIVKFLKRFESDDKTYIFNEEGELFEKGSRLISRLNHSFESKLFFYDLLKDAIFNLEFESDMEKILFIFSDSDFDSYRISKVIEQAKASDYEVHFFELKNKVFTGESVVLETLDGISEKLYELYKNGGI
ncbi:MAG: hypothetical protein DWQ19_09755 [Crenarchaeota archaeon]|nr:MAG: hypothetical protein DWQ19_09755 [Thermoproteota archaeon]